MNVLTTFLIAVAVSVVVYIVAGWVPFLAAYQTGAAVIAFIAVLVFGVSGGANLNWRG